MKRFLDKLFPSLAAKVALALAAGFLLAGSAFVYFAQRTGYEMLEKQAQTKARGVAESVKGILEHIMMAGRNDILQGAIESATTSTDIVDVFILRTDGTVALKAKGFDEMEKFSLDAFRQVPGIEGEKFLTAHEHDSLYEYVVTPIVKKPACVQCHKSQETIRGYVAMKIAMDDVRSIARQHRATNMIMTVLTFGGLGLIVYVALLLLVIKPIGHLHSHIRRIEDSVGEFECGEHTQFPLLTETGTNDEIGDLCRSFNNLVLRLNNANAAVSNMHNLQLQQANRLASTGEIAASMAHEIKNPIAGVLGALQVFDGEVSKNDPRKEILSEMMIQLERVNHAVNDLLSYARPAPPKFERVDFKELIQKVMMLLRPQIKGKQIAIEARDYCDGMNVEADLKQFQQVFWNIMHNAVQSIESKGRVSITSKPVNSSICVEITDTGKGIPREELDRVFKPFFTTKHKGTGLGMTISKNIVEQHNGSITLASTSGKGTTVTITIPLRQNQKESYHEG